MRRIFYFCSSRREEALTKNLPSIEGAEKRRDAENAERRRDFILEETWLARTGLASGFSLRSSAFSASLRLSGLVSFVRSRVKLFLLEPPDVGCYGVLIAALLFFAPKTHAATNDFFTNGLAAARVGNFSDAAAAFESELKFQPSSGGLVNLGVVEWQRGRAGAALLAWERAAWIDPLDEAAKQNLKFARAVAQVDAPELRWHESLSTWLPGNWWLWVAGAGLWLVAGALVLPRVLRWKKTGGQQMLVAFGVVVFIFALVANVGVVSRTNIGLVLKKNTMLRLTPTSGSELIWTLPAGEPVRRVKSRGNYFFIRTPMAAGWVEQGQVGFVNE